MMRRRRWQAARTTAVLAVLAFVLLVVSRAAITSGQAPPSARTIRALFIGNSYTYFNNLPELVSKLAEAGGQPRMSVAMSAPGGWRLEDHWEKGEARRLLVDHKWDYVILQDQSMLGNATTVNGKPRIANDESFRPWADRWASEIRRVGATPVFYLTWAHKGSPEDQATLENAYVRAARANNAMVSPVGIAWVILRKEQPSLELFVADGSHPSAAGSYLAACTFYATLFDKDPAGLPATITGTPVNLATGLVDTGRSAVLVKLSPEQARTLQAAAWAAHQQVHRAQLVQPARENTRDGR